MGINEHIVPEFTVSCDGEGCREEINDQGITVCFTNHDEIVEYFTSDPDDIEGWIRVIDRTVTPSVTRYYCADCKWKGAHHG